MKSALLVPLGVCLFLSGCSGLVRTPIPQAESQGAAREQPVQLATPGGAVHGTLLLPSGRGPYPVALLIAGSGPTDRNGNSAGLPGHNNSLRLLAEGLAQRGIATVRYDKRGIAESAPAAVREADLRFDTYVEDAAGWLRQLRGDQRFSTVSVIGHSEGALIGMRAVQIARADAFVSVAGVARTAPEVLRDQLRPQLPPPLWQASERILAALIAGQTTDSVPPELTVLYRPTVQPYLISWFRVNPAEEFARLGIPVLIAQGTTDIQVSVQEAQALQAARPDAEMVIIQGMNHVLKAVPADPVRQQASYSDPGLPIVEELLERVSVFLTTVRISA